MSELETQVQLPSGSDAYIKARQIALDARDLLAAIEARAWPSESLLLMGARLARTVRADRVERWLDWELRGYNPADSSCHDMLDHTRRRFGENNRTAQCEALPVIESRVALLCEEWASVRNMAEPGKQFERLRRELTRLVSIHTASLAVLHAFAEHVFECRVHLLAADERRVHLPSGIQAPWRGRPVMTQSQMRALATDSSGSDQDFSGCLDALRFFAEWEAETASETAAAESESDEEVLVVEGEDLDEILVEEEEDESELDPSITDEAENDGASAAWTALQPSPAEGDDESGDAVPSSEAMASPLDTGSVSLSDDALDAVLAATEDDIADFDVADVDPEAESLAPDEEPGEMAALSDESIDVLEAFTGPAEAEPDGPSESAPLDVSSADDGEKSYEAAIEPESQPPDGVDDPETEVSPAEEAGDFFTDDAPAMADSVPADLMEDAPKDSAGSADDGDLAVLTGIREAGGQPETFPESLEGPDDEALVEPEIDSVEATIDSDEANWDDPVAPSLDQTDDESDDTLDSDIPMAMLAGDEEYGDEEDPETPEDSARPGEDEADSEPTEVFSESDIHSIMAVAEDGFDGADLDAESPPMEGEQDAGSEEAVDPAALEELADRFLDQTQWSQDDDDDNDPGSAGSGPSESAPPDEPDYLGDEPFAKLDAESRSEVESYLAEINPNLVGSIRSAEINLRLHANREASHQSLRVQRKVFDGFADHVRPASDDPIEIDGRNLPNETAKPFVRLFAWLREAAGDTPSARPFRYILYHHYRRLDPEFFRAPELEESEALLDRTLSLLHGALAYLPGRGYSVSAC